MTSEAIPFGRSSNHDRFDDREFDDEFDDFDDDVDDCATIHHSQRITLPSSADVLGLIRYYVHEAKNVLTQPTAFLSEMPTTGGLLEPGIFLAISAAVYALMSAIGHLNPLVFFISFLSTMFYVTAGASFASKIFTLACGGQGNFEGTFRVFAYSKATLLFAWISVGSMPIGGWIAVAYTVLLNIFGIAKVQKLQTAPVAGIVVVLAVLQFMVKNLIKF